MGILEDVFTAAFRKIDAPSIPQWVEWIHIPIGITHCEACLKLDNCWFVDENKPALPQHPHCHCEAIPIPFSRVLNEATDECRYSKFDPYLFDPEGIYGHEKGPLFNKWGYTIEDSEWLRAEVEKQGLEKYIAGQYTLGDLDENGQRVNIRVEIPRKDKEGTVSFKTGWMARANGHIELATPYGGK